MEKIPGKRVRMNTWNRSIAREMGTMAVQIPRRMKKNVGELVQKFATG